MAKGVVRVAPFKRAKKRAPFLESLDVSLQNKARCKNAMRIRVPASPIRDNPAKKKIMINK